jgi:hypothetical protein
MLQDHFPHERQIEVIPQSGDLENRQQDAQKEADAEQAPMAPDNGDHDIQNQSQNGLRNPIALSCPHSPLAVRLGTISGLAAGLRALGLLA